MKKFKELRNDISDIQEEQTVQDKIKQAHKQKQRMRVLAKQKFIHRKRELALKRQPTPKVINKRAAKNTRTALRKHFFGKDANTKHKETSIQQRAVQNARLDKKTSANKGREDITKKREKIRVRRMHVARRQGKDVKSVK